MPRLPWLRTRAPCRRTPSPDCGRAPALPPRVSAAPGPPPRSSRDNLWPNGHGRGKSRPMLRAWGARAPHSHILHPVPAGRVARFWHSCPIAQLGNLRMALSDVRQPLREHLGLQSVLSVSIFAHLVSIFDKMLAFLSLFRLDP